MPLSNGKTKEGQKKKLGLKRLGRRKKRKAQSVCSFGAPTLAALDMEE